MKARTKLEHRVMDLSLNWVLNITQSQKEWAYKECLEHKGFANKTSAFCLDCGNTFSLELIHRKRAICPTCKTKLKIEISKKRTDKQHTFFAITNIVDEFQVIRNFELISHHKKGERVRYFLWEIIQYWVQPDLKVTMIGRNHNLQGYCDSWGGDWSIRKEKDWFHNGKFEVYPRFYHPESEIKKEYKKFGVNHNLRGLTFIEAIEKIPNNPQLETLVKAKQYELARLGSSYQVQKYWPSIKICLRNKYKVKDYSMWIDYLELLKYFNKDLRNAKYVCPKNLKKEHDRLMNKKRVIQEREELERKKKRTEQAQKEYLKQKQMFFGLMFSNKEITVKVLESIQEFVEEGDKLNHCVFASEYYNKEDSLILSARIDNEPIETIEVSLSQMKIIQARGRSNGTTEHHDKIVRLVNKNLPKIKKRIKELKQTA